MKKSEWAAVILVAILLIGSSLIRIWAREQPFDTAAAQKPDHSNCQYPDRWSNPPNGCDNSDPAVPECIKAFSTRQSEQECIDAFVAAQNKPVIVPAEIEPVEFEGK